MTALRHSRAVGVSLAALALALALGDGARGQTRAEPSSELANPVAAQSLERLSATRGRPLFVASRRPPAPPPPAPVAQRAAPALPYAAPTLDLFGIVRDDVDGSRAVVRASANSKILRVRVGDDIAGWMVSRIEPRQLVLSLGERSTTFTMFSGHGATPAVGPPAHLPVARPPFAARPTTTGRQTRD